MKDFTLVSKFIYGYRNREDITVLPPGVLVEGSQNVLTNTFQRIGIRKGYTLDGQSSTVLANIQSAFDWQTSKGLERNMRAGFLTSAGNDGKLQYRYIDASGNVTWNDLLTGLTSTDFNFTTFWDTTEELSLMLAVNGQANIIEWDGAITTLASTTNTASNNLLIVNGKTGLTDYGAMAGTSGPIFSGNNQLGTAMQSQSRFLANPANGQTLTFNINSSLVTFTFVTVIGAVAGNVLIGANLAATINNAIGLINAPSSTTATQVALSGGDQTLMGFVTAPAAGNTITKTGTDTWGTAGFYLAGTRQVTINGTVYTYTGGEFSTTLTGVTPDPTGEAANSIIIQTPRIHANTSATDLPLTSNDLISTLNQQVYVGSLTNSSIYISKVNSFTDYAFTSPVRVVGEGAIITTTSPPTALIPQEGDMYISAGKDEWYDTSFTLSSDNANETLSINRLNTTALQASQSQALTSKIANDIVFLSFEPIINTFGRVDNVVLTPQMTDVSFSIINLMNQYDFANAAITYFKKFVYVAVPAEGIVLIYNMTDVTNPYWEAPQILPIARFSIIGGSLYGHSSLTSESYKLFDGTNDNGNPIEADAFFSFNNYGTRSNSKGYNQFYVEGYITANSELNLGIQYDIDGCATNTSFQIDGDDKQIVCIGGADNSLGKNSLGKQPLGSVILPTAATLPPKFRVIKTFPIRYFYEDQISFSSTGIDEQWEIIGFGPQLLSACDLSNAISQ